MRARVAHRLGQLVDNVLGRRHVGVTHAEVDNILARRAMGSLNRVDLVEDVGRQALYAVELAFHRPWDSVVPDRAGWPVHSAQS